MRASLPLLLLSIPALFAAEAVKRPGIPRTFLPMAGQKEEEDEGAITRPIPAISVLPDGSILEKVILPRYDGDRKLRNVLRCDEMTLVSSEIISGRSVTVESYGSDQTVNGRLDLASAVYDQKKSLLKADQTVKIVSDRVVAEGSGLIYSLERQKGFLTGPATTTITNPPSTAMNAPKPALRATALLGAAFLPLVAQTPPPAAGAAGSQPDDSSSMAAEAREAGKDARNDLRSILKASEEANKATAKFLEEADLLAANETAEPLPEPKPLEVEPDPEATVISCQGGIYLDPDLTPTSAVLVYLKGVTVKNPRIDLKGANELKVFFERTAEEEKKDPAKENEGLKKAAAKDSGNLGGMNLGDPSKIVATGAVAITLKPEDGGEPTLASGRYFSYDLVTGDIVIRGGYAWVMQGNGNYMKAKDPNAGIYFKKDLTISTDDAEFEQGLRIPKK